MNTQIDCTSTDKSHLNYRLFFGSLYEAGLTSEEFNQAYKQIFEGSENCNNLASIFTTVNGDLCRERPQLEACVSGRASLPAKEAAFLAKMAAAKPVLIAQAAALLRPYSFLPVALFLSINGGPWAAFQHGFLEQGVSVAGFLGTEVPASNNNPNRLRFGYIGEPNQAPGTVPRVKRKAWFDGLSNVHNQAVKAAAELGGLGTKAFQDSPENSPLWSLTKSEGSGMPLQFRWGDVSDAAEQFWAVSGARSALGRELTEKWLRANSVSAVFRGHQHNGKYLAAMLHGPSVNNNNNNNAGQGDGTVDSWGAGLVTTIVSAGPGPRTKAVDLSLSRVVAVASCPNARWHVAMHASHGSWESRSRPRMTAWQVGADRAVGLELANPPPAVWPAGAASWTSLASAPSIRKSDQTSYVFTGWSRSNVRDLDLLTLAGPNAMISVFNPLPLYLHWREHGAPLAAALRDHRTRVLLRNNDIFTISAVFGAKTVLSLRAQGELCTTFVARNDHAAIEKMVGDRCGANNDDACYCFALREAGVVSTFDRRAKGDVAAKSADDAGGLARVDIMRVLVEQQHEPFLAAVQAAVQKVGSRGLPEPRNAAVVPPQRNNLRFRGKQQALY